MSEEFGKDKIKDFIKKEIDNKFKELEKDTRTYIKEEVHGILAGYQAQNESHYTITNNTLNSINKFLEYINENYRSQEKEINKLKTSYKLYNQKDEIEKEHRKVTCPQEKRIRIIEDKTMTSGAVRKWIAKTVGVTAGTLTIIYIALKLIGLA